MKIATQIVIKAPLDRVFNVFTDLATLAERVDGIQSVEILNEPAQMAVGTKWRETRIMFGKEATEEMWVTELNNNQNYIVEAESHGTKYRSEYTFVEKDGGVEVSMIFSGTPQTVMAKIMGIMFFFFVGATRKALEADMQNLKAVCESV